MLRNRICFILIVLSASIALSAVFTAASTVPESKNNMHFKITQLNSCKELVEFEFEGRRHVYFIAQLENANGSAISKVGDYGLRPHNP